MQSSSTNPSPNFRGLSSEYSQKERAIRRENGPALNCSYIESIFRLLLSNMSTLLSLFSNPFSNSEEDSKFVRMVLQVRRSLLALIFYSANRKGRIVVLSATKSIKTSLAALHLCAVCKLHTKPITFT